MAKKTKFDTKEETMEAARELGNKKKFTIHDLYALQPKSLNQEKFMDIYKSGKPVIHCSGVSGSGKTALAFYMALTEVLDESSEFDKIVMVRSAVETRKMGFLPGSLDEKAEAYEAPYRSFTQQFIKYNNAYDNLKALGYYEFLTTSYLRGATFDNCVVICEEFQNLDYSELHTVMTRVGINSRIIFTGDNRQDDLKRQREKSGFEKFKKVLQAMPEHMVGFVEYQLTDVVRSGVVREFLEADYKFGED
ncbi:MAG: hypothetical protein CMF22_10465 [Idiomarinaceae bacterium]|nr:hypothetical protein [Idiomarinaceae bacterium]MBG23863.1 hypothetical protein [Idiomarinaceae bacterium]|tara:strand:- start:14068 stop:14814 length:747 start_codon:yes stop_codon:yes gene_type:complete